MFWWGSVPYNCNSKLWVELELKSGSIQFNSYNVRFELIQFVVAANCNLNWIGRGMWTYDTYLENPLRFVVSRPHTKENFCISVNLNFCQSLPLINLFPCCHGQSFHIWGYKHAFNWPTVFTYHEWPWIYCQIYSSDVCWVWTGSYSPRRKHWLPSAAIEWKLIL